MTRRPARNWPRIGSTLAIGCPRRTPRRPSHSRRKRSGAGSPDPGRPRPKAPSLHSGARSAGQDRREGRLEECTDQRSPFQRVGRRMSETTSTRRFRVRARRCPCQRASTMAANGPSALTIEGLQLRCVRQGQLGDMEPEPFAQLADQPRKRGGREREVPLFRRETVLPLDHGRGDQITLPGQDQIVRRCGEPGQVPGEGLGCEILRPQDRSKRREWPGRGI